jgi:UTP-glucose-1-phosphate uridylyltransferase
MIKKCMFPAAGYGTRFLPATKAMPKEMLPIVSKPLIQYGVEEALEAGLKQIAMITGRGKHPPSDRRMHLFLYAAGADEGPRPRHPQRSVADR